MIEKTGASEKILKMAKTNEEFDKIRESISQENELVRCGTCQHLIAKKSSSGYVDVQHKKEALVIKGAQEVSVKCPVCGSINTVL